MQDFPVSSSFIREIDQLSATQLAWLSGYAWAKSQSTLSQKKDVNIIDGNANPTFITRKITILSASQTGNSKRVAQKLYEMFIENQIEVHWTELGDYKSKNLLNEDIVFLVSSTQGEGDPPEEAIPLFKFLNGKKPPNLTNLSFAVLALGDSSYPKFCEAGRALDEKLVDLGAQRILERVDCDVDFEKTANQWQQSVFEWVKLLQPELVDNIVNNSANVYSSHEINTEYYSREKPFTANLSLRQKITSRDALKDIEHIEIDISGSHIQYQPGDSLGVIYHNDPDLVAEILAICDLTGDELIRLDNGEKVTIRHALLELNEITKISPQFIKGLAALNLEEDFLHQANDPIALQKIVNEETILTLLKKYPAQIFAQSLSHLLRPITPRFYSIASSQLEVGDEVHLTVGVVRYEYENRIYEGGASGLLGRRLQEGDSIQIFIEQNNRFRLPENLEKPIIMIGSGTGVAPYRAFMQHREQLEAIGKNWLIFGNQKFTDDFLYQTEWQRWHKLGLLHRITLAWSRQQTNKVYVQHKLKEEAEVFWQWINEGAHIYICGDAEKMAEDVEQTILSIIQEQGNLSAEDADEYLNTLRENNRYQRDVY